MFGTIVKWEQKKLKVLFLQKIDRIIYRWHTHFLELLV